MLLVYTWTLQKDINGSSHDYLLDTGEIQVALNLWGTIHYTGYPHYTILSAILTQVVRGLGFSPATAASVASLIWSLLGLGLFYKVLAKLMPDNRVLPALAILVLGVAETFWMHSIIAEVYSFSLFLVALALLMSFRLREGWHSYAWLGLVFVLGTAVAHHRILLFILPMIGLILWTEAWRWLRQQPSYLLYSGIAFLAPFLAYIYLPLRAGQGSIWVYGQPQTWHGFWQQFTGSEVTGGLLRLPQTLAALGENLHFLGEHISQQLPWLVVLAGSIGLIVLARKQVQIGLGILWGTAVFPLFIYLFPQAVWVPAVLMPSIVCIIIGTAYLLYQLTKLHTILHPISWLIMLFLAVFLLRTNLPFVERLTQEPSGRNMVTLLQAIPTNDPTIGQEPVVALPWGADFFAAAYGLYVTQELSSLQLVDHRANFKELLGQNGRILTPGSYINYWSPAWWQELVGSVHYNAATPHIVAIQAQPPFQAVPLTADFALGNGIRIRSLTHTAQGKKVRLQIYWEATEVIDQNYSVAVHLVTQFPPTGAANILAQADAIHPVQGWYPTTEWAVGEVVGDQYELEIPEDGGATAVALAMYHVNETGQFENSDWFVIPLEK